MGLEMSESSLEYAMQVTQNGQTVHDFFRLMAGDQNEPSVLYRSVMKMLNKHVEHLRIEAGILWGHERAVYETSLWLWYAAYILGGLYAMYGRTFPRLHPRVFKEIEGECDAPIEVLREKLRKNEALFCNFGEVSKAWILFFRYHTDDQGETYLCGHGIFYIYALGAAVIGAKEDQNEDRGEDASLSCADRADIALRDTMLGQVKTEIEEVLEKMQFD